MADFHALILQALKTKNSDDPAVRQAVYQSSRNALVRMLDKSGNRETESGAKLTSSLEESIAKIETEYAAFLAKQASVAPQPAVAPEAPRPPVPEPSSPAPSLLSEPEQSSEQTPKTESVSAPVIEPQVPIANVESQSPSVNLHTPSPSGENLGQSSREASVLSAADEVSSYVDKQPNNTKPLQNFEPFVTPPQNQTQISNAATAPSAPAGATEHVVVDAPEPTQAPEPLNYKRKSPWLRGFSSLLFILLILGVIAWLGYAFITNLSENANTAAQTQKQKEIEQKADDSNYLEILSSTDPSSLITSGRGSAEVITELNVNYMRIQSIRSSPNSTTNAEPILLELKPGVLQEIAGKSVTVEMRVKSGTNMDGLFSIQCLVGDVSVCDRKRFPVGQQPENVIFALQLDQNAIDQKAYLAINTDVKSATNPDGLGHPIDILHIRIRIPKA